MKPFGSLMTERSEDVERCVREASNFIARYAHVSGSKHVSLEQVSWLAAVISLGLQEAQKISKKEGNVINVVADSSMEPTDHVA